MLFLYEGAFTIGFQATVWVYPSEILPLSIRQRGSAISTACNWIVNFAVVRFTPPAIDQIGWRTYIIFAVFNLCFLPVIYLCYPETKGLMLEDVDRLFLHHPTGMRGMGNVDLAAPARAAAGVEGVGESSSGRASAEEAAAVTRGKM